MTDLRINKEIDVPLDTVTESEKNDIFSPLSPQTHHSSDNQHSSSNTESVYSTYSTLSHSEEQPEFSQVYDFSSSKADVKEAIEGETSNNANANATYEINMRTMSYKEQVQFGEECKIDDIEIVDVFDVSTNSVKKTIRSIKGVFMERLYVEVLSRIFINTKTSLFWGNKDICSRNIIELLQCKGCF